MLDPLLQSAFKTKWGKLTACPTCGVAPPRFSHKANTKLWQCNRCKTTLSPLAGTIFHKSETPLKVWLKAIRLLSKGDITGETLAKKLNVTYKTAWRLKRLIQKHPSFGLPQPHSNEALLQLWLHPFNLEQSVW